MKKLYEGVTWGGCIRGRYEEAISKSYMKGLYKGVICGGYIRRLQEGFMIGLREIWGAIDSYCTREEIDSFVVHRTPNWHDLREESPLLNWSGSAPPRKWPFERVSGSLSVECRMSIVLCQPIQFPGSLDPYANTFPHSYEFGSHSEANTQDLPGIFRFLKGSGLFSSRSCIIRPSSVSKLHSFVSNCNVVSDQPICCQGCWDVPKNWQAQFWRSKHSQCPSESSSPLWTSSAPSRWSL